MKGKGGPSDPDLRDRLILDSNPDAYQVYFNGHDRFRISKAVEFDLRLKQLSNTVSTIVEDVAKIEALLEKMSEWKQAGEKKARGRLPGSKKKAASTSSS
jgi:hypothetical protein